MQDAREAGSYVPPEADCSTDDTKENSTRDNCYGDFLAIACAGMFLGCGGGSTSTAPPTQPSATPTISSFSPTSGSAGISVTVTARI